jgi:hypothetical protein
VQPSFLPDFVFAAAASDQTGPGCCSFAKWARLDEEHHILLCQCEQPASIFRVSFSLPTSRRVNLGTRPHSCAGLCLFEANLFFNLSLTAVRLSGLPTR